VYTRPVRTEFGDWLPRVEGDRVQLQQVVLNLMNNAIDAMRAAADGPRDLVVGARREDAGHVLVTVRDTGEGLPQGEPERIFDPFYSTKPEGMGMGLAITRSIVEAHGGTLTAENISGTKPGDIKGARFVVTLPAEG
ncbi:sensor histidine kinase, partial [Rhizobiaceae sp. 2RAB30]